MFTYNMAAAALLSNEVIATLANDDFSMATAKATRNAHRIVVVFLSFLPREAAMLVRSWVVILSVRLSVSLSLCPSHACFVTKRKNIQLKFLHRMKG